MKKNIFKETIILIFIIFSLTSFSAVEVIKTTSYSTIAKSIDNVLKKDSKDTLIIFDIDNTILTSTQDLGGDIWYQWQTGKLDIKPNNDQKVTNLYGDAIYLFYALLPMDLVDENIPSLIKKWQESESTIFALSSRGPENLAATKRELKKYNINFAQSALKNLNSRENPIYLEKFLKRNIAYVDGITQSSGLDKGKVIKYLLEKTNRKFKNIIFIDDSLKNVTNVEKEFKDNKNTSVKIFYYTKIVDDRIKKNGTILTQEEVNKMAMDWKNLNSILLKVYPARNESKIYTK